VIVVKSVATLALHVTAPRHELHEATALAASRVVGPLGHVVELEIFFGTLVRWQRLILCAGDGRMVDPTARAQHHAALSAWEGPRGVDDCFVEIVERAAVFSGTKKDGKVIAKSIDVDAI